jgi:predicted DNA-binding transcriptional regulator AlpA
VVIEAATNTPVNFIRTDEMSKGFNFKIKPTNAVSKLLIKPTALITATAANHTTKPNQSVFDQLPDSAYLREAQLVRSPKRHDSQTAPLPFSAPTLWRMVAAGKFPAPRKLSARVTAWQVSEVRAWLQAQASA